MLVIEQHQLLSEAYRLLLVDSPRISIVGSLSFHEGPGLVSSLRALRPDVALVGVGVLTPSIAEDLLAVRCELEGTGLLVTAYWVDAGAIEQMREVCATGTDGCVFLPKHAIGTVDQLVALLEAVAEGRREVSGAAWAAAFGSEARESVTGLTGPE